MISKKIVTIYTDGACSGNPGPGGWGAILEYDGKKKEIHGGEPDTTNNRMELTAAIMAFDALKRSCEIHIHTDSMYLHDGITKWLNDWKARGWKTADKKPVKNQDLWEKLSEQILKHKIKWHWVKAHNNHPENERADELARLGIKEIREKAGD